MRKLTGSDTSLRWIQPRSGNRLFELKSDVYVVATLWWEKTFGTLARAQAGDRKWTFKRVGIFNKRVTIQSQWSDVDIGVFRRSWSYTGTLDLQGRTYAWKHLGFLSSKWGFARPDGTMLVTFSYLGGLDKLFKTDGEVEIAPEETNNPDLPLLLTLGWYLMVTMAKDMAAVAATAAI